MTISSRLNFGRPTKFFRGHLDCLRGYVSPLPNYSVCTMSLCLAVVTVTKHQHDIMFELFINTTTINSGQLLTNYCKINMITNIKQCIQMSCGRLCIQVLNVINVFHTGFVSKGRDHLQLIKCWPGRGLRRGENSKLL